MPAFSGLRGTARHAPCTARPSLLLRGALHGPPRLAAAAATPTNPPLLAGQTRHARSNPAHAGVLAQLRDAGVITGWRNELYPISSAFDAEPSLLVERAAAPHFGIRAYGVHVNGWVAGADGRPAKLWVGRRSATKQTWPGKLDHIVAGGQVGCRRCSARSDAAARQRPGCCGCCGWHRPCLAGASLAHAWSAPGRPAAPCSPRASAARTT
jgi:hypothetical protein